MNEQDNIKDKLTQEIEALRSQHTSELSEVRHEAIVSVGCRLQPPDAISCGWALLHKMNPFLCACVCVIICTGLYAYFCMHMHMGVHVGTLGSTLVIC